MTTFADLQDRYDSMEPPEFYEIDFDEPSEEYDMKMMRKEYDVEMMRKEYDVEMMRKEYDVEMMREALDVLRTAKGAGGQDA